MVALYFVRFSPIWLPVVSAGLAIAWGIYEVFMDRKIRKLGGRAARQRSWCHPFGFDLVYQAVSMGRKNQMFELWKARFNELSNPTTECTITGIRVIYTMDPENIKAVLATQFLDWGKGEWFHDNWSEFLGDSIFTTDGAQWHASRQLIRSQFIKSRVSDLHIVEKHVQKMVALIPEDGSTVDMLEMSFKFTLDAITEFLFGYSVDSLNSPQVAFAESFAAIQRISSDLELFGPLRFLAGKSEYRKHLTVLNNFVQPFVERVIRMSPEELKTKASHGYNFLHALAEFTSDRQMLRDQLVSVLLAGRDTTAGTLSWVIYELSKKPECVRKLRAEIMEYVGPTSPPTSAHLKDMKYLQHVINETLRLYPTLPFNLRISLKDTTLPTGGGPDGRDPIGVLKGTPIGFSVGLMQQREDLFGPDVSEFKPERWDTWSPKSWHYIPFNGGPRICVGMQFALTEIAYVLTRLFQKFESLENRQGNEKQFIRADITSSPGVGVKVAFRSSAINS